MSRANSTAPRDLCSIAVASNILGLSQSSVRNYASSGALSCYVLPSGHRRFSRKELVAFSEGESLEDGTKNNLVVAYCRCSTLAQKESLDRQVIRVREYCVENYPDSELIELSDNSSGANFNRKGLVELLRLIESGKLDGGKIVCEFIDRLSRGTAGLISVLCDIRQIELVYIEHDDSKTDTQLMMDDFLSLIHCYNCRQYSARGAERLRKPLEIGAIERGRELLNNGMSVRAVTAQLEAEGFKNQNGTLISRHQVNKYAKLNTLLEKVMPKNEKTSVELWADKAERVDDTKRTIIKVAYAAYEQWAEAMSLVVLSQRQFCKQFRGIRQIVVSEDGMNQRAYVGLTFPGVPHKVCKSYSPVPTNESAGESFVRFYESRRGFNGRISQFQADYKNWAIAEKVEQLSKIRVRLNLAQLGAKLTRSNGVENLSI